MLLHSFFGRGNDIATKLSNFADAIKTYVEAMGSLSSEEVDKVSKITDAVSKGNVSSGVYAHNFIVAPITSYQLLDDSKFNAIIEDLKNRDDW